MPPPPDTTITAQAAGDGVEPYEEYGKRLRATEEIAPQTSALFGDQVSLYNGATEFTAVDIDLPGNSGLPVQLRRRFAIEDRRKDPGNPGGFGDWDLDLPWIEGTFTQQAGWTVETASGYDRCSNPAAPRSVYVGPYKPHYSQFWDGNKLHRPGGGSQELLRNAEARLPRVADGRFYPWITRDFQQVNCLPATANGYPGEAFQVLSPEGVRITFDWAVVRAAPALKIAKDINGTYWLSRSRIYLLATRVEDRFGNWVRYSYSGDQLTRIEANDGRVITLTWSGGAIVAASSALGTWSYGYTSTINGPSLGTGTRPDGSRWTYAFAGSLKTAKGGFPGDYVPPKITCQYQREEEPNVGSFTYTMGAPSGATAVFTFSYERHRRNYIPLSCTGDGNPYHSYPDVYAFFDNFTLISKRISGPGLPGYTWSYVYGDPAGGYYTPSVPGPYDATAPTYIPPGTCSGCSESKTVTVTGPGEISSYIFGAQYARNEGRLLRVETATLAGALVKSVGTGYVTETEVANLPFPENAGATLLPLFINPMGARLRPERSVAITEDGTSFTRTSNSYDVFANPVSVTRSSSLGYSRTDVTDYAHNLARWVIGQVQRVGNSNTGLVVSQTDYDATTALPIRSYAYGQLKSSQTYAADGTLATVADGAGRTATLSNWYRGIPRSITYADGRSESAVVSAAGWITAWTDENGYTTGYAYDAMGRLTRITYPAGDSVAWNATNFGFTSVAAAEYGLPAGHWRHTTSRGNYRRTLYFDALWRPVLQREEDIGNAATVRLQARRYDHEGRPTFAAYPVAALSTYDGALPGTRTSYDVLGRVTRLEQDSELGVLVTTTEYLSGFATRTTNPRGFQSTTTYLAYDQPMTDWPVAITQPEGVMVSIGRDRFGKPTLLQQRDAAGSLAVSRRYVYDGYQRLCKRIEPETGAAHYAYDAADNLIASAEGDSRTGQVCDIASVPASQKVTRSYDARNRLLTLTTADGNGSLAYTYAPDGRVTRVSATNPGAAAAATTYSYNRRRLLTAETLSHPGYSGTLGYAYDANGSLATQTYPSGLAIDYAPNALGQATRAGTYAQAVSYYPNGALRQFSYGNGIIHTLTQNARQLPARVSDGAIQDVGYTYDAAGNITRIDDYATAGQQTRTMAYDGRDRLTSASSPQWGGNALYSYDVLDNLRTIELTSRRRRLSYDTAHRLSALVDLTTGATAVTFSYDPQGRRTGRNAQAYAWDATSRLLTVSGSGVETYRYDGFGRRVQATHTDASWTRSQYGQAGALLYQENSAPGMNLDHVYVAGSLVAIRRVPRTGGAPFVRYQHTDALGSPVAGTDEAGALVVRTTYEPYGLALNRAVDGVGYGGHVMDAATGLVYMQQRYYDPAIGRFLSTDPVQADANTGANFNRYAYAKDNPYRYTDPDGRYSCSGKPSECKQINAFVDTLNKALSQLKKSTDAYSRVSKVAAYIGKLNDKNGVTLSAGKLGPDVVAQGGKGGNITIDLKNASSVAAFYQKYNSSMNVTDVRNAFGASSLAHEARHEVDYRNPAIGYPTNKETENRTELNAYWTEVGVNKGLGISSDLYAPGASDSSIKERVFDAAAASTAYWCNHGNSCQ